MLELPLLTTRTNTETSRARGTSDRDTAEVVFSEVGQKQALIGPWTRALGRVLLLLSLMLSAGAIWLVTSPSPWNLLAKRLVRDLPGELAFQNIDLTGPGDLFVPTTWEVTLEGLRWSPSDPGGPSFEVDRLTVPLPDWGTWQEQRRLQVPWARVVGLHLTVPTQRPPPPWEATDDPLTLAADEVEVWDTRLTVAPDDPLPGLTASQIYAKIEGVTFRPGTRDFSGLGEARVGPLRYGDLDFESATVPQIVADSRGVVLDGVTFGLAAGTGTASLRFEGFLKTQTTLGLDASVQGLRIQEIISATSDRPSPIRGRVSAEAEMQTDPEAERGTGVLNANVRIPELIIPLDLEGKTVGPFLRGVLEVFGYRAGGGLRIKSLHGPIRLGRGWVSADGLRSTVLGVSLEVRARIDQGKTWILVRRLPRARNLGGLSRSNSAVGLVIEGYRDELWLRVADQAEMKAGRQVGPIRKDGVQVSH